MPFRLRTLLIALTFGPPALASMWFVQHPEEFRLGITVAAAAMVLVLAAMLTIVLVYVCLFTIVWSCFRLMWIVAACFK